MLKLFKICNISAILFTPNLNEIIRVKKSIHNYMNWQLTLFCNTLTMINLIIKWWLLESYYSHIQPFVQLYIVLLRYITNFIILHQNYANCHHVNALLNQTLWRQHVKLIKLKFEIGKECSGSFKYLGFKYITAGKEHKNWSDQILSIPRATEHQQRKESCPKRIFLGARKS